MTTAIIGFVLGIFAAALLMIAVCDVSRNRHGKH
ncbi:hypothetical protein FEP63_06162 [Burkholderia multivorans]|nr:hypothetical protein [Burkholderia multivorans]MDR8890465.1 hypothetical protein [Burkholderia multivorans]MDR8891760.1 hypothetical protein [Burkholderia multivorans]MDR8898386.1 hypothetical protein [Burkholderia multivorans]MDR8903995.1 hypothetical protein [Burkholderia multivorans]